MNKTSACCAGFILLAATFVFCSCSQSCSLSAQNERAQSQIKLLSWNLQTFFDGSFDGNEYDDFKSGSSWSEKKYEDRLDRLAVMLKSADADVVVMEELENEDQLHDIYNRLCNGFNFARAYSYGCFAKDDGSSIGCGVMSRYPLSELTVHGFDIRSEEGVQPAMRPLMSLKVLVREKPLLLLVNHWKSKSGGEEESEVWRNYQEAKLAQMVLEANTKAVPVVACGDFNRDLSEFKRCSSKTNIFNVELRGRENAPVYSPWYGQDGTLLLPGSYYYNGQWERIDHFFSGKYTNIQDFKIENKGDWVSPEGYPLKYLVRYGSGYSDHFPISCTVTW